MADFADLEGWWRQDGSTDLVFMLSVTGNQASLEAAGAYWNGIKGFDFTIRPDNTLVGHLHCDWSMGFDNAPPPGQSPLAGWLSSDHELITLDFTKIGPTGGTGGSGGKVHADGWTQHQFPNFQLVRGRP